jgi:glutamate dehydrogenase
LLTECNPERLASITDLAFNFLKSWWDSGSHPSPPTSVRSAPQRPTAAAQLIPGDQQHERISRLLARPQVLIALLDRPFIINTITATLRTHGLHAEVFLHPILTIGAESVSLSYLEIREAPPSALKSFLEDLRLSLPRLVAATNDFSSMSQVTESLRADLAAKASSQSEETASLLSWLLDEGFVFEGVARWSVSSVGMVAERPEVRLGLFRTSEGTSAGKEDSALGVTTDQMLTALLYETREDARRILATGKQLLLSRSAFLSPIHHRKRLTCIHIVSNNPESGETHITSIIGQLTSKALLEEASRVPLVRTRVRKVLDAEGLRPSSHLYKAVLNLIDSMPKHEVLTADEGTLQGHIRMVFEAERHLSRKAHVRLDANRRGAWVVVTLPSEDFEADLRRSLQHRLSTLFRAPLGAIDQHCTSLDEALCRLYFYCPVDISVAGLLDTRALEGELVTLTKGWKNSLIDELAVLGKGFDQKYASAFGDDYQALYSPAQGARDAKVIETLSANRPLAVRLDASEGATFGKELSVSIFQLGKEITLSKSLPTLEHAGFEVLHERSCRLHPTLTLSPGQAPSATEVHLHRFPVRVPGVPADAIGQVLERSSTITRGLEDVLLGASEDDALNALMVRAGLDARALSLLRSYCMLLWQVKKFATRQTIREALVSNPTLARAFWEIAQLKFDPSHSTSLEERKDLVEREVAKFREALRGITDITADRILRALILLLQHTVRTNFYQGKPVVALKIHSEQLELLSAPRPLFDIFVCAPHFEGVHLRGSRVARGGIRWSDRREDFRTEVRDLMRTQQVKNAIIVPSGAKGGFVVKDLPLERAAQAEAVKRCYQDFIRALLSLTDNRVGAAIVPPPQVIAYDEVDPYLVVAADKGTASFSDVANAIATEEYKFWLGDAFASGGSVGYDHKKLGITAKGAWEAVLQHFKEARIDYQKQPFTVVGIGDMSGDVFGNGLLLSDNMKLLGAFNHRHIFIDPSPDAKKSWVERKRLFDTPFSQWSDYRTELLSKGGAIYDRHQKEITLAPEARASLKIGSEAPAVMSGEQLITYILKAPVDLLWNGGIGTYVKSRTESDADVGDSTNDAVRVNADELRCRVVAEGGNLGFTQRSRIDFAQRGGLINTDAIDNSGGVDTSDHEVNLKILFQSSLQSGKLTRPDRDAILRELAPAVVEDVLSHNRGQAVLLMSAAKRGSKNLEYFRSLIQELSKRGYVHRTVHMLPTDEELDDRMRRGVGLFRPELAICLAGVKLWMKDELLAAGLTKDPSLREALFEYFPARLHTQFKDEILAHPLGDNIVATEIANDVVETVGLTFVHRMCISQSVEPASVLSALLAARSLLGVPALREMISVFDTFEQHGLFLDLRIEVSAALREATTWLITNHTRSARIADLIERYGKGLRSLLTQPEQALHGTLSAYFADRKPGYEQRGLTSQQAALFAAFPMMPLYFEMIRSSHTVSLPPLTAAQAYCSVLDALDLVPIFKLQRSVTTANKWEHELKLNSYDEIRRSVAELASAALASGVASPEKIQERTQKLAGAERIRTTVHAFADSVPDTAMLGVFARQLRLFATVS